MFLKRYLVFGLVVAWLLFNKLLARWQESMALPFRYSSRDFTCKTVLNALSLLCCVMVYMAVVVSNACDFPRG